MRITVLIISLLIFQSASAQICKLYEKIPADSNQISLKHHAYAPDERMEVLKSMIIPDSIRYYLTYNHLPQDEANIYFDLDTSGIYFIDLDFDGDKDLVYTARSGNMELRNTSIYMNESGKLRKAIVIDGRLIDIYKYGDDACSIYTLWKPCCDSYTNRLENYFLSSRGVKFTSSVSFVGRSRLTHVPDMASVEADSLNRKKKQMIKKGTNIYAMKLDFKAVRPYFREDNKVYRDALKKNDVVPLMTIAQDLKIIVLSTLKLEGEMYYAIMTEKFDAPKSHFEWSAGHGRSFIAWVKAEDIM